MRCLIKNFTRQKLTDIRGPVTIVSGRKRRITFIECRNDINSMIDVAKIADLVSRGFGNTRQIFRLGSTVNRCEIRFRNGNIRIFEYRTSLWFTTHHGRVNTHGFVQENE